jgi:hypothetical protein
MTSTSALSPKRAPADATAEVSEFGRKELRSFPEAASSEPLRLESITLAFGGVTALKDINLAVAPGAHEPRHFLLLSGCPYSGQSQPHCEGGKPARDFGD